MRPPRRSPPRRRRHRRRAGAVGPLPHRRRSLMPASALCSRAWTSESDPIASAIVTSAAGSCSAIDARTSAARGPAIHGSVRTSVGRCAGGEHDGAALGHRRQIGDVEDTLAAHRAVGRAAAAAVRDRRRVEVEVADELRELGEELDLRDAAAVDLDVRRAPELAHAVAAPHLDALRPGLQDRHEADAARAVVALQVGQLAPATDVRGLVEDRDHRHRQAATGRALGALLGGLADRDRQRGDDRARPMPRPSLERL